MKRNTKRTLVLVLCAVFVLSAASAAYAGTLPNPVFTPVSDLEDAPVPGGSVPVQVNAGKVVIEVLEKLDMLDGWVSADGESQIPLDAKTPVVTGMIAQGPGRVTPIVVIGDVLGTGKIGLSQLIRLAQAFTGDNPLTGLYLLAGDLNQNGKIDLGDLTMLATLILTGQLPGPQNPPIPETDVMAIANVTRRPLSNPRDNRDDPTAHKAAEGANDFAFQFSSALLAEREDSSDNFVCSPYSVWLPLAALLNATSEEKQPELLEALCAAGLTPEDINNAASRMLYGLTGAEQNKWIAEYGDGDPVDPLKIANAVFVDRRQTVTQKFAETFASDYLGESISVDFRSQEAVDAVNDWCSKNTDGLIPKIIDSFDDQTVAAIANAIYFSDRWEWEFDPEQTKNNVFHGPSGDVEAPFMTREGYMQRYYEDDTMQAMPLEFRTGGGLAVMLPKDGDAEGLLASLTDERLTEMLYGTNMREGTLLLPRFDIDSGIMSLNDSLQAIGVPLFDQAAPAITELLESPDPLYISQALQNAKITVDEKGTTAAAVTVMAMDAAGALPEHTEPFEMNCDRPFVFVLYGDTYDGGAQVLFTGVVNQPETV